MDEPIYKRFTNALRSSRLLAAFRPALNCLLMFILGWGLWESPIEGAYLAAAYCYARSEIRNFLAANVIDQTRPTGGAK